MTRSALTLGLIAFTSLACASAGGVEAQRPLPDSRGFGRPPMVSVWLTSGSIVRHGERTPVRFRADRDAYVTVARLDTDGRISILYPSNAYQQRPVRAGRTYTLSGSGTFRTGDRVGLGYVFAIASNEPFDYSAISRGSRWDYMYVRHARHDPFEAMYDLAETIVWDRRTRYSLDYAEYHVGRYVSYPRYMCVDAYRGDPYSGCRRFALIYRQSPHRYGYGPYYGHPDRAILIREPARYGRIEQRPTRPGDVRPVDAIEGRRREVDDRDRRNTPNDPRRRDVVGTESNTPGAALPTPRRAPDAAPQRDGGEERPLPQVIRPPRRAAEPESGTRSDDARSDERPNDPRATPRRVPETRAAPAPQTPPQAAPRQAPRAEPERRAEPDRRRDPPQRDNSRAEERRDDSSSGASNSTDRRRRSPE